MPTCPTCSHQFDTPIRFCPRDGAALASDGADSLIGELVLGAYRLTGVAGQGATGVVYGATDERLGRQVAVKVLHRSLAGTPAMRRRFRREARAVARITHPNIVRILDMGDVWGRPAIVMDYVQGRSLAHVMTTERVDARRAVRIVSQVASALAQTHAAGVVHRDLKPANLMLRRTECGSEVATVLDFGVAKLVDGAMLEPDATQLTRAGEIFGTPSYIAPEQARGDNVDARADIYSLGVVLYELLTGQVPFTGSAVTILLAHLNRTPAPPRSLDPRVPRALETIVMRCLRKRAAERYASAAELADVLGTWLGAERAETSPGDELSRWVVADEPGLSSQFSRRRSHRVRRVLMVASLVALGVLGERMFHRYLGHGGDVRASGASRSVAQSAPAASVDRAPTSEPRNASAAASSLPRRAVVVAQAGYSVRVLLPERLVTGVDYEVLIDAWDPSGVSLEAPEMIATIDRPDGSSRGVAARPTTQVGRYRFRRVFSQPGTYRLRLFPPAGDTSIRLFFEVSASPGA